ncbi:hypothetical protein BC832DRAFT_25773 [Gaertneriomyces semiglobifer]|nr:hypothetical protein BC832DRAFT_25773 [Gaertneriomyces semiglobifer]
MRFGSFAALGALLLPALVSAQDTTSAAASVSATPSATASAAAPAETSPAAKPNVDANSCEGLLFNLITPISACEDEFGAQFNLNTTAVEAVALLVGQGECTCKVLLAQRPQFDRLMSSECAKYLDPKVDDKSYVNPASAKTAALDWAPMYPYCESRGYAAVADLGGFGYSAKKPDGSLKKSAPISTGAKMISEQGDVVGGAVVLGVVVTVLTSGLLFWVNRTTPKTE